MSAQPLSTADWHRRFQQQAGWTADLRRYLYDVCGIAGARRVLEVGCGTGVISAELARTTRGAVVGLDLDLERLRLARAQGSRCAYMGADALRLPFPNATFDATLCHFLLLWVREPLRALAEMRRVTRAGGVVIALAEPDYGGRIDHPAELAALGRLQAGALQRQGADPYMGRKLAGLFSGAGFVNVHSGLLGGQWNGSPGVEAWEAEWAVLENDLRGEVAPETLAELRRTDLAAWQHGERVLFVPTFYAWARA